MRIEHYTGIKQLVEDIPGINHTDLDLKQYLQNGDDAILTTPAIYISLGDVDWNTLPGKIQRGVMPFTITLVNETMYGDDQDITNTEHINHFAIESLIYQALMNKRVLLSDIPTYQALEGTKNDVVIMESIVRKSTNTHKNINNLIVTTTPFTATVFDYKAADIWQTILAVLNLDISITQSLNNG